MTDQSGKAYQLAGDTSKLSDHVGHEVRITGSEGGGVGAATTPGTTGAGSTTGAAGATQPSTTGAAPSTGAGAGAGAAAGAAAQTTFNVKKVKMISSTCKTSSK